MAAAAAAASLRSFGSRLKGLQVDLVSACRFLQAQKVSRRPLAFVQNRAGLWVLEDVCRKEGRVEKLKKKLTERWSNVDQRVRDIIQETVIRSAIVSTWGAGVLAVSNALDRLGIMDTGLTTTAQQKQHIAAMVKEENDKTLVLLQDRYGDDRVKLKKLEEEFHAHQALTKLWMAHLMEKASVPLTRQDVSSIQEAFSFFYKGDGFVTLDEARYVLKSIDRKITESELHKIVAESGKISLPQLLKSVLAKAKHAEADEEEATPKE